MRFLRLLTNSLLAGALGAAYLTILVLQLNPQVPLVSASVWRWYLTLGLCVRDGMDRETMGSCYVWTAVSAVLGARLLYVLTNLDRFDHFGDERKPRNVTRSHGPTLAWMRRSTQEPPLPGGNRWSHRADRDRRRPSVSCHWPRPEQRRLHGRMKPPAV